MKVTKATLSDLENILPVYERAREYMRQTGNPNQWKTTNPTPEMITEDIKDGSLYMLQSGNGIEAVFAFIQGKDPTYNVIDGAWLNDKPYHAVHRVASAGKSRGVLKLCMEYCLQFTSEIRIDTHEDNKIMQHSLEKLGFKRCGIIRLQNGEPRIAYHLSK